MALADILDRVSGPFKNALAEFQESAAYTQIKERYDSLPPIAQKGAIFGGVALVALLVLSVPFVSYQSSEEYLTEFSEKKDLIRDLLRMQRNIASAPQAPPGPSSGEIKGRVQQILTEAALAPEQILSNEESTFSQEAGSRLIPPSIVQNGVSVQLAKLNLKQVLDIGHQIQSITNAHVLTMEVKANQSDVHYFDVLFKIAGLSVPEEPEPAPAGKGKTPPGKKK